MSLSGNQLTRVGAGTFGVGLKLNIAALSIGLGSGSLLADTATLSGVGEIEITGTGVLVAGAATAGIVFDLSAIGRYTVTADNRTYLATAKQRSYKAIANKRSYNTWA